MQMHYCMGRSELWYVDTLICCDNEPCDRGAGAPAVPGTCRDSRCQAPPAAPEPRLNTNSAFLNQSNLQCK